MPDVQKPHWRPCISVNPICTGSSTPSAGEPLDRPDLVTGGGGRQHRARLDRLAVHQHHAGAAVRGVAAPVRAGEAELVAKEVHEQHPGLDIARVLAEIHGGGDEHGRQ